MRSSQVAKCINTFRELGCPLPGNRQTLLGGAEILIDRLLRSLRLCKLALGCFKESGCRSLSTDQ